MSVAISYNKNTGETTRHKVLSVREAKARNLTIVPKGFTLAEYQHAMSTPVRKLASHVMGDEMFDRFQLEDEIEDKKERLDELRIAANENRALLAHFGYAPLLREIDNLSHDTAEWIVDRCEGALPPAIMHANDQRLGIY